MLSKKKNLYFRDFPHRVDVDIARFQKIQKNEEKSNLQKERSWGTKFGNIATLFPINIGPLNTLKGEEAILKH